MMKQKKGIIKLNKTPKQTKKNATSPERRTVHLLTTKSIEKHPKALVPNRTQLGAMAKCFAR